MTGIDLFAGLGGFSQGAAEAGVQVLYAVNHWDVAVQTHQLNHPEAIHERENIHVVDWTKVPSHDLLMASPACTGHTPARGKDKPHHDAARGTAWGVINAAEIHQPEFILVENVQQYASTWKLFPAWAAALNALGYTLAPHVLDAADFGVPQHRVRLFILATKSQWPLHLNLPTLPHQPVSSVIDWDKGTWTPINKPGRAARTLERINQGRKTHGERFSISYYGATQGGRSLERPIGTITTRDRHALIDGPRMRMLTVEETRRIMGFPDTYHLPASHKHAMQGLGNAVVPPVATAFIQALRAQA